MAMGCSATTRHHRHSGPNETQGVGATPASVSGGYKSCCAMTTKNGAIMIGTTKISRPIFRTSSPPKGGSSAGGGLTLTGASLSSGFEGSSSPAPPHAEFDDII